MTCRLVSASIRARQAFWILAMLGEQDELEELLTLLNRSENEFVRRTIIDRFRIAGAKAAAAKPLLKEIHEQDADPATRQLAAEALAAIAKDEATK